MSLTDRVSDCRSCIERQRLTKVKAKLYRSIRLHGPPSVDSLGNLAVGASGSRRSTECARRMQSDRVWRAAMPRAHGGSRSSRDPSSALPLETDLLSTNRLHQIAHSEPEHTNGRGVPGRYRVVYRDLHLVGSLHRDIKRLVPFVGARRVRNRRGCPFDFNSDGRLVVHLRGLARQRTMHEVSSRSQRNDELSGYRLAQSLFPLPVGL